MFERFRTSKEEATPEIQQLPPAEPSQARRDQATRLVRLARNFDATVRAELGDEVADQYAAEHREVTSKVHRSSPPSVDSMRF